MALDQTAVVIVIGGVVVTPFAQVGQVRIDDILNDAPNTAALSLVAASRFGPPQTGAFALAAFDAGAFATAAIAAPILTPPPIVVGAPIAIYLGAVDPAYQVFGGQIVTREQKAEFDVPKHVRYNLTCIDHTRALNARKVLKDYATLSATAIVLDLIATFAPAITAHNVAAGLPNLSGGITFTFEDVSRALSRVAEKIGAYWYIDYVGDLHFWTGNEPGTDPTPIVPGGDFADLKITVDLTQVRTRELIEGDGGMAALTLPAGDAILPLDTAVPFNVAGGLAIVGPARVSYTSKHAGGVKTNTVGATSGGTPPPAAPGAPTVALATASVAGALVGGPYKYAVTLELSDGSRSDLGTPSASVTIVAAANPGSTGAAFPSTPIAGPIKAGVTATYATSFVDAQGNETIATTGGTVLTGRPIASPPAMTVAILGGGAIDVGYRQYAVSALTASGETAAYVYAPSIQTVAGQQTAFLGIPVALDPRAVAVRYYRSTTSPGPTGGPVLPWRRVADVLAPASTNPTYSDVNLDSALATATLPVISTGTVAGEGATVTIPTSTDARVVGRRVYRKDGPGEYRFVAEIRDNTTTTFTDTIDVVGGTLAPTVNRLGSGAVNLTAIPLGPATTIRRRIFRTTAGGTLYRELTSLADNTTTTYLDTTPDAALGGSPLPPQGAGAGSQAPTPAGSTTLRIASLANLPPAGWVGVESGTIIRYAGSSTTGGNFLTGIPATGPGAIAADIQAGAVVTSVPTLIGVAPLGQVSLGDAVNLLVQVDDLAAQTALAAIDGSDGVIENYVQDRRLSDAGARARGLADLALFKTVEVQVSYTTHDPQTRSGRTVHIDLPAPTNLTGDFLIQKVTIADVSIAKNWYPKRTVDASTTRFSFDDVLARLLMEST